MFLVPDGSDMVSYSLRDSDNLQDYVLSGKTPHEAAEQEIMLRKMVNLLMRSFISHLRSFSRNSYNLPNMEYHVNKDN